MRKEIVVVSLLLLTTIALGLLFMAVRGVYADPPQPVCEPARGDVQISGDSVLLPQCIPAPPMDMNQIVGSPQSELAPQLNDDNQSIGVPQCESPR
jgi:hypothetical protein